MSNNSNSNGNNNNQNIHHDTNNDGGGNHELSNKIEEIMLLMDQRARGHASTEQVEAAVSSILGTLGAVPPSGNKKASTKTRASHNNSASQSTPTHSTSTIQVDQGNYDDDDDDDDENDMDDTNTTKNKDNIHHAEDANHKESKQTASSSSSSSPPPSLSTADKGTTIHFNDNDMMSMEEYQELLKEIPMGKVGAQMMTAFGDGSRPNVEALKLALEGTRRALQYIVMDARALRRRIKLQYTQAQQETLAGHKRIIGFHSAQGSGGGGGMTDPTSTTTNTPTSSTTTTTAVGGATPLPSTDPTLVYRAFLTDQTSSHDPLGRHPPCGFDVEQLARLYPEELQAYDRWSELHEEYANPNPDEEEEENPQAPKSTITTTTTTTTEQEDEGQADDEAKQPQDYWGGHLKERVAAFNIRTDHMPQDMYLHFARIRQGSFLPRRGPGTKLEKEWNNIEVPRGRGRGGTWMHMPAIIVRFLHWLGFQPPDVPPPDAETTHVLAFLGHDRMGRIVEKAIQLRNFRLGKDALEFRELPPWEQLTVEEIQAALNDPDVKPSPLFPFDASRDGIGLPNVQLYFGPGFEQRLELEMEEMLAASSSQREHEDDEVRRKEREFFQKLSRPIQELDGLAFLVEDHKKNKLLEEEEEESQANMAMEQEIMDESNGPIIGHENCNDGDNVDLAMTRNDTPPKRKSPASKTKQAEQGAASDPHRSNEPVSAVGKSTQRKSKRGRSK